MAHTIVSNRYIDFDTANLVRGVGNADVQPQPKKVQPANNGNWRKGLSTRPITGMNEYLLTLLEGNLENGPSSRFSILN